MTRMLLEWKANVSCADDLGSTALHFASKSRLERAGEIVKWLLEAGAHPSARDCDGRTPLLFAVQNESGETEFVLKLLLEHGATDLRTREGELAFTSSICCKNQRIHNLILQHDEEIQAQKPETRSDTTVIFQTQQRRGSDSCMRTQNQILKHCIK